MGMVNNKGKSSGDPITRWLVIGMVALVVVVGAGISIFNNTSKKAAVLPSAASVKDGYGIVFNEGLTPVIDVWEDFQCPYCKFFEDSMGDYLETLIREKQAEVTYHMASFLGQESVRASNAANCAVPEGRFIEYHRALFDIQGGENSGLFSNKNLVEIGTRLGITSESFANCVNNNESGDVVKNVASSMKKNGVEGTPTVFINGKPWNRTTSEFRLEEFKAAVEAAKQ